MHACPRRCGHGVGARYGRKMFRVCVGHRRRGETHTVENKNAASPGERSVSRFITVSLAQTHNHTYVHAPQTHKSFIMHDRRVTPTTTIRSRCLICSEEAALGEAGVGFSDSKTSRSHLCTHGRLQSYFSVQQYHTNRSVLNGKTRRPFYRKKIPRRQKQKK